MTPPERRFFYHVRKDSRLYSYLPVVGVTLKLYNLLPHPTVKRTSRVSVEKKDHSRAPQEGFLLSNPGSCVIKGGGKSIRSLSFTQFKYKFN